MNLYCTCIVWTKNTPMAGTCLWSRLKVFCSIKSPSVHPEVRLAWVTSDTDGWCVHWHSLWLQGCIRIQDSGQGLQALKPEIRQKFCPGCAERERETRNHTEVRRPAGCFRHNWALFCVSDTWFLCFRPLHISPVPGRVDERQATENLGF